MSLGGGSDRLMTFSRTNDLPFELPAAAAEDRRQLMEAVKKASRCGEKGRPSVADFDAYVNLGWARKAAHLYILPLDFEDALRRYDAANPDAKLGGSPLDFHAVDKNLILCVGGVHDMLQEALCEYLSGLVGKKVGSANIGRVLVDHLKGLPAKDRTEFITKLVATQGCLRLAAKESALGLVSDEADCAKVMKRVNELSAEPAEVLDRVAKAQKEFKAAFEKCVKAADLSKKK
jgi:hypothetical protein